MYMYMYIRVRTCMYVTIHAYTFTYMYVHIHVIIMYMYACYSLDLPHITFTHLNGFVYNIHFICKSLHWEWMILYIKPCLHLHKYVCIYKCTYMYIHVFRRYTVSVPGRRVWWCWVVSWSVGYQEILPTGALLPHSPQWPHPCTHHPAYIYVYTCSCRYMYMHNM